MVGCGVLGRINDLFFKGGCILRWDDDYVGVGYFFKFGDWDDNVGDSNYIMMF